MAKLFGTDGIRGEVGRVLTPDLAYALGRAAGQVLVAEKAQDDGATTVVIGRDSRISGQMLEAALSAGLTSVGVNIISVGLIPTPAVAYLVRHYRALAGVVISASHNPFQDNGIKFFNDVGQKLSDEVEDRIEALIQQSELIKNADADRIGRIMYEMSATEQYADYLKSLAESENFRYRVVVDCANGSASPIAESLFLDLGLDVKVLADLPDGVNINKDCGSTHPESLQRAVVDWGADIGFAFDGDADRFLAVDHQGNLVDGDFLMAIFAAWLHQREALNGNQLVLTVMSNLGLKIAMQRAGIAIVETKVGDRYVNEGLLANDANLGGEQSGHIIFRDWNTTGDGFISAIMLLNIMRDKGKKLAELSQIMERYPQVLINVPVTDKHSWQENDIIQEAIAKGTHSLGEEGRILVRASGTENLLRIMVEGKDETQIQDIAEHIATCVREACGSACP